MEMKDVKNKKAAIVFGDIFGSVVCNTSLVLGIATVIAPIVIEKTLFYTVGLFMLAVVALSISFLRKEVIKRWEGILLFAIYLVFLAIQISYLLGKGFLFGMV